MIKNSFIFLDGIREGKERLIWKQCDDWDDFLKKDLDGIRGISRSRKLFYNRQLCIAKNRLFHDDASYFARHFPSSHHWRLYEEFRQDAVFLDIETDKKGNITVIGLFDGEKEMSMVEGINLDKNVLMQQLRRYKMIVTFNGLSFDLPRLRNYFQIGFDVPIVDLKHACQKLGLNGGLKAVEEKLGIDRPHHLKAYGGDNAIDLWRAYHASGDREYLQLLVEYNREDCVNLKPIADFAVKELWNRIRIDKATS